MIQPDATARRGVIGTTGPPQVGTAAQRRTPAAGIPCRPQYPNTLQVGEEPDVLPQATPVVAVDETLTPGAGVEVTTGVECDPDRRGGQLEGCDAASPNTWPGRRGDEDRVAPRTSCAATGPPPSDPHRHRHPR